MSDDRHSSLGIHLSDAGDPDELLKRRQIVRRAKVLTAVVLLLLAVGAGRTVMSRMETSKVLESDTTEHAKLYVRTATAKVDAAGQTLALPGTLQGYVQAPIAARASGYLRRWYKDIGSRVQKGELLAEIDAPEIEQQLSQAVAARQQTASSLALAHSTMERWEALRKRDAVSQQELDEKRSLDAQARANLAAADANVERLKQMLGFKRVVAPFSGVITRRNVDVGDLIDAGGGAGRTMFVLAQTDVLRVYINVPQTYSQLVKSGQEVAITQAELPGQTFRGTVARTAAAIDPATRTMQVEVTLQNKDGVLLPGAYVQVSLPLAANNVMMIPTNALMIGGEGTRVATVDNQNRVHLRPIQIGRNYGENVEVLNGLKAGEQVVLNPPDALVDGDEVQVAPPPKAVAAKGAGAKGTPAKGAQ